MTGTKTCRACGVEKPTSAFYADERHVGGFRHQCKSCLGAARARREKGPEYVARKIEERRARTRRLRLQVVAGYGGRCSCCGEAEEAFLCVDHVAGLAEADRWPNTGRRVEGEMLYRRIIRAGFPDAFQLLCFNCNNAKRMFGSCPHQQKLHLAG